MGLSLVLLINAGLLVRSLQAIRAVDSGLRTDDVFVVYPGPKPGGYQGVDHDSYYPAVLQRLAAIAGVRDVSVSLFKPAAGGGAAPEPVSRVAAARWFIRGAGRPDTGVAGVLRHAGSAGARRPRFRLARSLAQPAGCGDQPEPCRSRVRRAARPSVNAFALASRPENQDVEVVGIVADARLYNLKESNVAAAYVPALQTPDPAGKCYVVRGQGVSMAAVTAGR